MCVRIASCSTVVLDHKREHMCASQEFTRPDLAARQFAYCCDSLLCLTASVCTSSPLISWLILAMLWGFVSAACVWKSGSYSMYSIRKHSTRSQETFLKGSHQHDNNTHTHTTNTHSCCRFICVPPHPRDALLDWDLVTVVAVQRLQCHVQETSLI